jgi:succinyl-CoA synthetase beta subunit
VKLQEYEELRAFSTVNVKVPRHILARDVGEAVSAYRAIGELVMLKAQVTVAGRLRLEVWLKLTLNLL